nr:hypothetical protein HUO10_003326 [Paraburkholderia busanensis]
MKKQTPMQMRKEVKPQPKAKADKKSQHPMSAMERYAQERAAKSKAAKVPPLTVEMHDPHSDMHTLARAAEIRRNPSRHRAAKTAAKQRIKDLADVAE